MSSRYANWSDSEGVLPIDGGQYSNGTMFLHHSGFSFFVNKKKRRRKIKCCWWRSLRGRRARGGFVIPGLTRAGREPLALYGVSERERGGDLGKEKKNWAETQSTSLPSSTSPAAIPFFPLFPYSFFFGVRKVRVISTLTRDRPPLSLRMNQTEISCISQSWDDWGERVEERDRLLGTSHPQSSS